MNIKTLLAGPIALVVLTSFAAPASADHSWNNYHWARIANPIPLQVVDSVTADWQLELTTAIGEWSQSAVLDLTVTSADDSNKTRRRCSMVQGKMRVCNHSYGYNGWLGLATIGLDSQGHIDQGTAQMNDSYSYYWADPNEKRHVMCQEIGHIFGLGHTSEDGTSQKTCMDYSVDPGSVSPNAHDYEQLSILYQHLDSYDSFFVAGSGGGGGGGDKPCRGGPKKCGVGQDAPVGVPAGAIRVGKNPFAETWVKSRSDGGYWIYHVRLAPAQAAK